METRGKKGGENWHVLWQWCLASVGAVLAIVLGILVGSRFPSPLTGSLLALDIEPYLARFALGAVVGLVQWVVLRTRLRRAGWWILATALAWAPAWARLEDGLRLSSAAEYAVVVVAVSGVAGGIAGLGPWLVLRRHRSGAGWLLALPVATGVAAGLALALAPLLRREVLGVLGRVVARSDG